MKGEVPQGKKCREQLAFLGSLQSGLVYNYINLSYTLQCYTRISYPEQSCNNTHENMILFHVLDISNQLPTHHLPLANCSHVKVKECQFSIITAMITIENNYYVFLLHADSIPSLQLKQRMRQLWINLKLTLALWTPHYYRHLATMDKSQPLVKCIKK